MFLKTLCLVMFWVRVEKETETLPYFFMNMPSTIFYAVSGYRSWIADQKAKKKEEEKNIYIHRQFYAIYIHCLIEFNVR